MIFLISVNSSGTEESHSSRHEHSEDGAPTIPTAWRGLHEKGLPHDTFTIMAIFKNFVYVSWFICLPEYPYILDY